MPGIYEEVQFPRVASRDRDSRESMRPYVVLNMVQSADGKAAIGGKASGLGTDIDRGVMRTLRSRTDAVMVGGGTVRAERLSLSLDAEDTRAVPRAVILTNSGDLPLGKKLVRDSRQDVLVLLPEGAENGAEERLARPTETRRVSATESGEIDVGRALEILKADYGVNVLLCEGGPTLNRALMNDDLVDELFLTIAPVLVGAQNTEGPRSPSQRPLRSLRLISSQVAADEMFLRYAVERHS
jgi:riboflavin-specific deaminase-like protein